MSRGIRLSILSAVPLSLFTLLLFSLVPSPTPSQTLIELSTIVMSRPELSPSPRNMPFRVVHDRLDNHSAWDAFFANQTTAVAVYIDPRSGAPSNIISSVPLIPGTGRNNTILTTDVEERLGVSVELVDSATVAAVVRDYILNNTNILRIEPNQLGPVSATRVNQYLWHVRAPQVVNGVPVRDASIGVTINHGNLVVIGTRNWEEVVISTQPSITADAAKTLGFGYAGGMLTQDEVYQEPTLELVPIAASGREQAYASDGTIGGGYGHQLVWAFKFKRPPDIGRWEVMVNAHDGEILSFADTNAHAADDQIKGGVYPATNTENCSSPEPWKCGQMQSGYPMPWADTNRPPPNHFTNSAGMFDNTGTATTALDGKYATVTEANCVVPNTNSSTGTLDLGGQTGDHDCIWNAYDPILWNCAPDEFPPHQLACQGGPHHNDECIKEASPSPECGDNDASSAAARTAFYEINKLHEIARGWFPDDTVFPWPYQEGPPDQFGRVEIKPNLGQYTCNGGWPVDENTLHLGREGVGSGFFHCRNSGEIASIIAHEWGHGLDDNDSNSQRTLFSAEAYADIAAMYRVQASCFAYGLIDQDAGRMCNKTADGTGWNWDEDQTGQDRHCLLDCSGYRDADWRKHADGKPDTPQNHVCPRCNLQSHCIGAPVNQAAWDFAAYDLQAPPFNYDSNTAFILANKIFFHGSGGIDAWYTYDSDCNDDYSDGCAQSNAYIQWLIADDDNGDILDGTPHMTALFAAFNRHNVACPATTITTSDHHTGPGTIVYPSSHLDTRVSDDYRETLQEGLVGGHSQLTHVWRFDNVPEGEHSLIYEGIRPNNSEGDNFQFSYSLDDSVYTDISGALIDKMLEPVGGLTVFFGEEDHFDTIYIRIQDTQATGGIRDSVSIDYLAIVTDAPIAQNSGCVGEPTAAPVVTVIDDPGLGKILSWTPVPDATKYWVFKTEGHAGCNLGKALISGDVTENHYIDQEVAPNRDYFYSVVAVGSTDACFGAASACPPLAGVGASSDYLTDPGVVFPPSSYQDTFASDDVHEVLKEERVRGDSLLTHIWQFDGLPPGSHELVVEGWRTDNGEGDDFVFSYSTDDVTYYSIPNAVIDSESETAGGIAYPFGGPSLSGTVYIRVEDTDPDCPMIDTLVIDFLTIRLIP